MGKEYIGSRIPMDKEDRWKLGALLLIVLMMAITISTMLNYSDEKAQYYRPDLEHKLAETKNNLEREDRARQALEHLLSEKGTEYQLIKEELTQARQDYSKLETIKEEILRKLKEAEKPKPAPPVKPAPKPVPDPAIAQLAECQKQCANKDAIIASLKRASTEQHLEITRLTDAVNQLNTKLGQSQQLLVQKRMRVDRTRLEMVALIAREERHWGELVPTVLAYYNCKPQPGEVVKLYRIGEKSPTIEIPLTGNGGNNGPHFSSRVFQIPCGLYLTELWKNGTLFNKSLHPGYFNPNPRTSYVIKPNGSSVAIRHRKKNMNVIMITGKGYDSSYFPTR